MITGFVHQVQLSVLVKAVGMGYLLGILFSFFQVVTCRFRKSTLSIGIRDIVFFIVAAFLCFIFSLKYCSGMMRFYVTAGELMGFIIFHITPGRQLSVLWLRLSERLCEAVKKLFKYTKKSQKN